MTTVECAPPFGLPGDRRARSVLWNTLLQVAGYAVGLAVAVATAGLLTRYLGVAGFGIFSLLTVVFSLLDATVNGSLDLLSVRTFAVEPELDRSLFRNLLGLKVALTVALA
ncbi:MAG TPA: hypothetical protein VMU73_00845, partial [Gaiellaceae bacterium]|nr:hypothetical protein [Gaiellaceae bacterium]